MAKLVLEKRKSSSNHIYKLYSNHQLFITSYTMSGEENQLNGSISPNAGIIPRVLNKLFTELKRKEKETEYSDYVVKCSFLELYNEELRDLLAEDLPKNNDSRRKILRPNLRIFEENSVPKTNTNTRSIRKFGTRPSVKKSVTSKNNNKTAPDSGATTGGNIIINGLKERFITSTSEALQVFQRGIKRRHVAATKMNDFSSRSHTIFTITLYVKANKQSNIIPESANEELYRFAKLNLVDLAGSENVKTSGAINKRAKEAGMINQSLLTLGKVINLLSNIEESRNSNDDSNKENESAAKMHHIPYRESKLTRILQDSLGGKTRTTIIVAISPARLNLEETISTLEYAIRAKSIQNKPQYNSQVMKNVLLKEMALEITKTMKNYDAMRQNNGIVLHEDNYKELMSDYEIRGSKVEELSQRLEMQDLKIESMTQAVESREQQIVQLKEEMGDIISQERKIAEEFSGHVDELIKQQYFMLQSLRGAIDESIKNVNAIETPTRTKLGEVIKKILDDTQGKVSSDLLSIVDKELSSKLTIQLSKQSELLKHMEVGINSVVKSMSGTRVDLMKFAQDEAKDREKEREALLKQVTHIIKEHDAKSNARITEKLSVYGNQIDSQGETLQQCSAKQMNLVRDNLQANQRELDDIVTKLGQCDDDNTSGKNSIEMADYGTGVTDRIVSEVVKFSMDELDKVRQIINADIEDPQTDTESSPYSQRIQELNIKSAASPVKTSKLGKRPRSPSMSLESDSQIPRAVKVKFN